MGDVWEDGEPFLNYQDAPEEFTAEENTSYILQAKPHDGWKFEEWAGDIEEADPEDSELIVEMAEDKEIKANFIGKEFNVSVDVEGEGEVEGEGIYRTGDKVELKAIPEDDWKFVEWKGYHAVEGKTEKEVDFDMPGKDVEIEAEFEEKIVEPPYFEVDINEDETDTVIEQGEEGFVVAEISNSGDKDGMQDIILTISYDDNEIEDYEDKKENFEVNSGETEIAIFHIKGEDTEEAPKGEYTAEVASENEQDKVTIKLVGDYLGFNQGAEFTYWWERYYEDEDDPEIFGEIHLEIVDVDKDANKIDLLISNGLSWEVSVRKEDNSYTTPYDAIIGAANIILGDYPVSPGVEGFEVCLPYKSFDSPLKAEEEVEYNGHVAWKFWEEDLKLDEHWSDDFGEKYTDKIEEARVWLVPYHGIIKQEIIFDIDSQDGEHILERSLIELKAVDD